MKILVVGYGSIGKRHVNNLLSKQGIQVIICTSQTNIGKLQNRCKIVKTLEEAIKEKPVAAIISNNTNEHVTTALKLATNSIHLFIEKPLSDRFTGTSRLLKTTTKKKLVTLVGCNLRFHKCLAKIKNLLEEGIAGRVISVKVESGSYLPEWHPYEDYRKSYASRKDLGGGVVLTCIHEIDYLCWFFGKVSKVYSITGQYSNLNIQADDLSAILMEFNNNTIGEIHLDYFQKPDIRSCKIIGTKGTIYWDSDSNVVKIYDFKKNKWIVKYKIKHYKRNDMYIDELDHFLHCVKNKTKTINPIGQAIKTLNIAITVIKSSKQKRALSI